VPGSPGDLIAVFTLCRNLCVREREMAENARDSKDENLEQEEECASKKKGRR